jgi:threonine dehydratase
MPRWAPFVKLSNCQSFAANVILQGETYAEAREHALKLSKQRGLEYVSGFDDPDIIAGQGTMGLEILEDVPDADAVIVPVGGAGLIAGVGIAIKAQKPSVSLIGGESKAAPTLFESLQAERVVSIESQPTLADGLAIAQVGSLCFDIVTEIIDDLVLVDEPEIARSVLKLLELEKTVVEGAGAVPLAVALQQRKQLAGKKAVLCLTGGNIDVNTLGHIIERGLAQDGRLCRIGVRINDRPGGLAGLTSIIASAGASVREITHDRNFGPADVASVYVWCILETRDFEHIKQVRNALSNAGLDAKEA